LAIALAQYRVIYLQGIIIMAKAKEQEQFTEAPETDLMAVYEANQSESTQLAVRQETESIALLNDKDNDTGLTATPVKVSASTLEQVLNTLDEIDTYEDGMNFTPRYKEFDKSDEGKEYRIVYMGKKIIEKADKGELKKIECVAWLQREDDCVNAYMNGGTILVDAFDGATVGEPYKIIYQGTKKTGSGFNVKDFQLISLRVPKRLTAN
jgi:hypothetical protein